MFFVKVDQSGNITAINSKKTEECNQAIDADLLKLITQSLNKDQASIDSLASDLSMVRALEDLIEVLVHKSVINITDLPQPVQEKITERKKLRKEGSLKRPPHGLIKL